MIATARGQQRPRAEQNPAYRLARHSVFRIIAIALSPQFAVPITSRPSPLYMIVRARSRSCFTNAA
jgi:hypothetical protein